MSDQPESTLPPEVAAHNLNQVKWFAIPYPNTAIALKKDQRIMVGECSRSDDKVSKGLGYYLKAAGVDETIADAMATSLKSLGIPGGGVAGGAWKQVDGGGFATNGLFRDELEGVLEVHGEEHIKALYKAGVNVPLSKAIKAELDRQDPAKWTKLQS